MPLYDGVHIHGVTLSLLLQSAAVSQQDCDGLLFGQAQKRYRSEFRDDESGLVQVQETHLHITSFVCYANQGCFYDAVGNVSDSRTANLQFGDRDPIIGWLSVRASPQLPAQPTMREAAVSASLQRLLDAQPARQLQPGQPVVFMVISQRPEHHRATLSLSYRVFQHLTPDKPPKAVELHTYSLQRHPGAGPAAPAAQLPANAVMAEYAARPFRLSGGPSEGQGGGGTGGAQGEGTAASPLLLNAAAASFQQVSSLEDYHKSQLRELQDLCQVVGHQSAHIQGLREEGERLARQLGAIGTLT